MTAVQRARRRRLRGGGFRDKLRGRKLFGYSVMTILVSLVAVGAAIGAGTLIFTAAKYREYAATVVPPEQIIAQLPHGGARIYDRNGVLLYEFLDEYGGLRRPVPLGEIAPALRDATISTEDQSFYENNGLNTRGLARAAIDNLTPFESGEFLAGRGGSSITQQLAKTVYIPLKERYERSITRKLKETVIALELTKKYSKDQILEWYLNSISYGSVYVGIQAAAEGYFGKDAKDLTLAEAALLAGIPQSPAAYEPVANPEAAKARQEEVLGLMVRHGAITQEQADAAAAEEIVLHSSRFEIVAPHFVLGPVAREITQRFGERALYEAGLEVTTTLDAALQKIGEEAIETNVAKAEHQVNGHNGALVGLDARTGEILAYVGSRDYFREDILGRNDNISSLNSPGSTLKPFTYLTAFQQGWSPSTGIIDAPAKVFDPSTGKDFTPTNPGGGTLYGMITVAEALGNSLNLPAFKTIVAVGVDKVLANYKQFGLTQLGQPSDYGPSLTLGGVDARLDDITYAYSALATGGVLRGQQPLTPHASGERSVDPVVLRKVVDSEGKTRYEFKEPVERRVIAEPYAYLTTSVLSNPNNVCLVFGCGTLELPDRRPSGHKTGTSEPFENQTRNAADTWAFGYTPDLVAGVWTGNSDNSPMLNVYSTTMAWPAWRDFMAGALAEMKIPSKPFPRPSGIEERELCWPSGKLKTDACPEGRTIKGMVASDAIPKDKDALAKISDSWWQKLKIDTRTGLIAAANTPAAFVKEESRLVFPKEELEAWKGVNEWAEKVGVLALLAPDPERSAAATGALAVTSPTPNQRVSGSVTVVGRAASAEFERYIVEWGSGKNPSSYTVITTATSQVLSGTLATWQTSGLAAGDYVVRVRLVDRKFGEVAFTVPVTVGSDSPVRTPIASITAPTPGATVRGTVTITGTAISPGQLQEYVLELGEGASPTRWTALRRNSNPVVNGPLGTLEVAGLGLKDGVYSLRLTSLDTSGGQASTTVLITVAR